jgi:asparagine synthase (glutamine-hydrolysing)
MMNRSIVNQFELGAASRYVPFLRRLGENDKENTEGRWLDGWQPLALGLGSSTLVERQWRDVRSLSVPSLCHYEDRMSMAMGREIRLPFLDFRLVDFLLRAPDHYKIGEGWTKLALRKAVEPILPPEIVWRKDKSGFANPQGEWLKRELRTPVLDAFADDGPLVQRQIIDGPAMIRRYERYCTQPLNGGLIWAREIFAPLSLHVWMDQFGRWIS